MVGCSSGCMVDDDAVEKDRRYCEDGGGAVASFFATFPCFLAAAWAAAAVDADDGEKSRSMPNTDTDLRQTGTFSTGVTRTCAE